MNIRSKKSTLQRYKPGLRVHTSTAIVQHCPQAFTFWCSSPNASQLRCWWRHVMEYSIHTSLTEYLCEVVTALTWLFTLQKDPSEKYQTYNGEISVDQSSKVSWPYPGYLETCLLILMSKCDLIRGSDIYSYETGTVVLGRLSSQTGVCFVNKW